MKLFIKSGEKITDGEFEQIKEAFFREFKEGPSHKSDLQNNCIFLLKDEQEILGIGMLIPVEPVKFSNETFKILGIGGIVANGRGKGYGKKVMQTIKKFLEKKNVTGVGFCGEYNIGFYQKCGFKINRESIRQFIYYENGKRMENKSNDFVLYWDSSDGFMKKVLINSKEDVILPRPPNW